MDTPGKVPPTINCHACGAVIDLSSQRGFMHVECQHCDAVSVVPLHFAGFLLLNIIGVGGSGTVFRAIDLPLSRFVAVKVLRHRLSANPEAVERFAHEARAAAAVSHPNIAQVYTFAEHDGHHYLSMELLERGSLDDRITRLGKIPELETLKIGRQISDALRAANAQGLLHRDIKPGNILFDNEGVPKIVDFGLVRAHTTGADTHDHVWGTPYYVAPEKLEGKPEDLRSDIYSLGATLYHALCGRPPAESATLNPDESPSRFLAANAPGADPTTIAIISRMLARNPSERYPTYTELIHDLERALGVVQGEPSKASTVKPTGKRSNIYAAAAAGIVVGLLAGALISRLLPSGRDRIEPPPPAAQLPPQNTHKPIIVEPSPSPTPVPTPAPPQTEPAPAPTQEPPPPPPPAENVAPAPKVEEPRQDSEKTAEEERRKREQEEKQRRLADQQLAEEFRTQLIADIMGRPYELGDLKKRNGAQLLGRLTKATRDQLTFTTEYGEIVVHWDEISPATVARLGEYYIAQLLQKEKPPVLARRLLTLAAFCRQAGLEPQAAFYTKEAARLNPEQTPQ